MLTVVHSTSEPDVIEAITRKDKRMIGGNFPFEFCDGEYVLANYWFDPSRAVSNALSEYAKGTLLTGSRPLSIANGDLVTEYCKEENAMDNSILDKLNSVISQLADGTLDTGVDPFTGLEK